MTLSGLLFQALNGLSTASSLFIVAAGLSLIFGVTPHRQFRARVPLYAGDLRRLSFATHVGGALGYWGGILATALLVGILGAFIEIVLLRRIYRAPELFQLLATFALVLVFNDAALWLWGAEDLLGPRAPGLRGAVEVLGRRLPTYDLFMIVVGPLVLVILHFALASTRFGRLVRAATQDREMVGALGVNQSILFTSVFALGALLAGLGGALQVAREPATLAADLIAIGDAFVVVVVGGMGSISGAYLAAVIIAEVKALCIGIGVVDFGFMTVNFSKLTLVAEFLVMAAVLIARPYGLLGRAQAVVRSIAEPEEPIRPASPMLKALGVVVLALLMCMPLLAQTSPYVLVLGIDVLIAVIFATSLHFIMGPGGMHSFGHAAYFGLGAYGAALLVEMAGAADGTGADRGAFGRARRRAAVRLVRGAAVRRLSRDADARLRADRLGGRIPMGGPHGRLERYHRRLAAAALRQNLGLFRADRGAGGCRRAAAPALFVRAVRLRHAGGTRFTVARRGHRHRRQTRALAGLRHCRRRLRRRRRPVRLRQRLDFAGDYRRRPLHRRSGDGSASAASRR